MQSEQDKTLQEMRTMRVKLEKLLHENKTLQEFKDLTEGKDVKCDKCGFTARSRNEIVIHMDIEHPQKEFVYN